jgi:phosphoserine aminotransferase
VFKPPFSQCGFAVVGDLARFPHRSHSGMSQPLKAAKTADFRCLALVFDDFALLASVAGHRHQFRMFAVTNIDGFDRCH